MSDNVQGKKSGQRRSQAGLKRVPVTAFDMKQKYSGRQVT